MARVICPPRNELHLLRTPLTPGELRVLDYFDKNLPDGWEIYIQPHLNGLRPDFVLLHPHAGIAVFEVKDWDLDAMRYYIRQETDSLSLWCRDDGGKDFRQKDEPTAKVVRYKQEIMNLYCPRLGIRAGEAPQIKSTVTAGVIVPTATTARIQKLLHPIREHLGLLGGTARYHPLAGGDALIAGNLGIVFPWGQHTTSKWMTNELAGDLRAWLVEPDYASVQRDPLSLNSKQRELATTRTATGYRRVRGPAGCGKSLSLAAHLSAEDKQVLVVSYNLTLLHYLRDLAVRYPDPRKSITSRITWLHFHGWCKRVCQEAGMEEEYRRLWRDRTGGQSDGDSDDEPNASLLETYLPALVGRAIEAGGNDVSSYDAILVDEGQDFHLEWWNLLRRVLRPRGEMMLVADMAQDLYARSSRWTDDSLDNAGFRGGNWFRLEGSHRFPPELVPHLRRFAEKYVPGKDIDLPAAVQGDPVQVKLFDSVHLRWFQVFPSSIVDQCLRAVFDITQAHVTAVPWADITLLVQSHNLGLRCVEALNARNIKVAHVFGRDNKEKKRRKLGFWMGDTRIKASTVHSFNGWESRAMVVLVDKADTVAERLAIYVALSRLKHSPAGSFLSVVCSAPELEEYGRSWPDFSKR